MKIARAKESFLRHVSVAANATERQCGREGVRIGIGILFKTIESINDEIEASWS